MSLWHPWHSGETLPNRTSNTIRWSPRGRHVVLATVGSSTKSELEFWDLDFNLEDVGGRKDVIQTVSKEEWGSGIQLLGSADHYGVTDVEWDPSGRYLATSASAWRHTVRGVTHAFWCSINLCLFPIRQLVPWPCHDPTDVFYGFCVNIA